MKLRTNIAAILAFCLLLLALQQGRLDRISLAAEAAETRPFSWQAGPGSVSPASDAKAPNLAELGYNKGVSMGGDLTNAPNDKCPLRKNPAFPNKTRGTA